MPAVFTVGELVTPDNIERLTSWFGQRWNQRAPATFNRNLDALRSAVTYRHNQDWLSADPTRRLRRRTRAPDRTRALSRSDIDALLALPELPLRERVLYRMLYETAARTSEVLALDVADLDLRNRRATVRRKGSAIDVIIWQTTTARLLPRLLNRRTTGPVFLTHRKARVQLGAADLDPPPDTPGSPTGEPQKIWRPTTPGRWPTPADTPPSPPSPATPASHPTP